MEISSVNPSQNLSGSRLYFLGRGTVMGQTLHVRSDGRIRRIRKVHDYADKHIDNICFSKLSNIGDTDTCRSEKIRP
jgi:hypothetical protein